jgi:hypothetical protein
MKALILGFAILSAASVSFADPVIDCPPDYRGGTMTPAVKVSQEANGNLTAVLTNQDGQKQVIQGQAESELMQAILGDIQAVDCKFY